MVVVFSTTGGGRVDLQNISGLLGYALIAIFGLVLLSYAIGGLGLVFTRRWSATIVFYAAIIEATLLLLGAGVFLYVVIDGTHVSLGNLTPLNVLPILLLLVFPFGIAYVARSLQKKSDLWQLPQQESTDELKTSHKVKSGSLQPAWLQKIFWVVIGTGLLLPAVIALFVVTLLIVQGEQFDIRVDDLFLFVLGTVLFALPYILLAFIARAILRKALTEGGYKPIQRLFVLTGIFFGITVFIAPNLFTYFRHGETAAVLIFAPFAPFMAALPGVVAGAFVGLIGYTLWKLFK